MKKYKVDALQKIPNICELASEALGAGNEVSVADIISCDKAHIVERIYLIEKAGLVPVELTQEYLEWCAIPEETSMSVATKGAWLRKSKTIKEPTKEDAKEFYFTAEVKFMSLVEKYKGEI